MKMKLTKIVAIVASSVCLAGAAAADLIAGWDFSQYRVDGSLDTGGGAVNTLPANYSALDATFASGGTGPGQSSAYGTFYIDGTHGSTNAGLVNPTVVPYAHDTRANQNAPADHDTSGWPGVSNPQGSFNAFAVQVAEGAAYMSRLGMTALAANQQLVFEADRGAVTPINWGVSFAGFAVDTIGPVDVDVEYAANCSSYSLIQTVQLTDTEQAFNVPLSSGTNSSACVRLRLGYANGQPVIDNVAVYEAPEPGMVAMLGVGVLVLMGLARRHQARRQRA
jgi:hypothetical protein